MLQHGPVYEEGTQVSLLSNQFIFQNFFYKTEILPVNLKAALRAKAVDKQVLPQLQYGIAFLWHRIMSTTLTLQVRHRLTTMRLKKDLVSSSLQSSSFSCSRFIVSATCFRTLLPSGIVTFLAPTSRLGTNGVIARLLSILQGRKIKLQWYSLYWLTEDQFLRPCCHSQLYRWLIPQRQHWAATQHSNHNDQTALQLLPATRHKFHSMSCKPHL